MKYFNLYNIIIFVFVLASISCREPGCTDPNALNFDNEAEKDDNSCLYNSNFNINFSLINENNLVNKYDTIFAKNYKFQLLNLKFYMCDINLNSDFNNVYLKDIHLFNIDDKNTHTISFEVEEGNYTSLNFGLGVNSEQNNTTPAQYDLDHPLGLSHNTFWAMEPSSYIFVMLEGKVDTLEQNNFFNLSYHLAHNDLLKQVELNHQFDLEGQTTYQTNIEIDISSFFENVDFSDDIPHQRNTSPLAELIMNNFVSSFEIQ